MVIRRAVNNNSAQHEQAKLYTVRATLKIHFDVTFSLQRRLLPQLLCDARCFNAASTAHHLTRTRSTTGERGPVSPPRPNKKLYGLALRLSSALPFCLLKGLMMPNRDVPVYPRVPKSPSVHPARWLPSRGREMRAHRSAFPSSDFRTCGQCQNRPNLC